MVVNIKINIMDKEFRNDDLEITNLDIAGCISLTVLDSWRKSIEFDIGTAKSQLSSRRMNIYCERNDDWVNKTNKFIHYQNVLLACITEREQEINPEVEELKKMYINAVDGLKRSNHVIDVVRSMTVREFKQWRKD